jgi:hypothetical protein
LGIKATSLSHSSIGQPSLVKGRLSRIHWRWTLEKSPSGFSLLTGSCANEWFEQNARISL